MNTCRRPDRSSRYKQNTKKAGMYFSFTSLLPHSSIITSIPFFISPFEIPGNAIHWTGRGVLKKRKFPIKVITIPTAAQIPKTVVSSVCLVTGIFFGGDTNSMKSPHTAQIHPDGCVAQCGFCGKLGSPAFSASEEEENRCRIPS